MFFDIDYKNKIYNFYPLNSPNGLGTDKITMPFGHVVLEFAKIEIHDIIDSLNKISNANNTILVNQYAYFQMLEHLSVQYNKAVISLILEHTWNKYPYDRYGCSIELSDAEKKLCKMRLFRLEILKFCTNSQDFGFLEHFCVENLDPTRQNISIQIRYNASNSTLYQLYETTDIASMLSLDLANMQSYNINVKVCANCYQPFIPSKRSDEIYCDRIYKGGKTCKQLGYFEKEKSDPFKRLFTAARKVQYARINYRKHIPNYREKHYKPWLIAAQKAKQKYESTNDIDGFEKWIKDNKDTF